jgi:hypothetical protein
MGTEWIPPWLKEGVAPLLSVMVIAGGFFVLLYRPEVKTETIALMTMVLGFYFGSSKSSQAKDETISKVIEDKK